MKTGQAFKIPQEKLDTFYTPPSTSVLQAASSPHKRRLSISGTISTVSTNNIRLKKLP